MPLAGGGEMRIELLRPVAWVEHHGLRVGAALPLSIVEARRSGTARVTDLLPCPAVDDAERVVTGRYITSEASVVDVVLEGEPDAIRSTPTHRFRSATRQGWVPAACLQPGEEIELRGSGVAQVADVRVVPGREAVYNLEVWRDHTFFVGTVECWVHNQHGGAAKGRPGPITSTPRTSPGFKPDPKNNVTAKPRTVDQLFR